MSLVDVLAETSVSSSRLIQETEMAGRGVSAYGAVADFIDKNIEQIDMFAEGLSDFLAQQSVQKVYHQQYFKSDEKIKSFFKRNVHLSQTEMQSMEAKRVVTGTVVSFVTEILVKNGARAIANWSNQKDRFITFEQLYSVLAAYISDAPDNANKQKAIVELNKIRNSFPLDLKERKSLAEKYKDTTVSFETLDVSSLLTSSNTKLKEALAYFLIALRRQLFGAELPDSPLLQNYYSLLDFNGKYASDLAFENQEKYDSIATDQAAYLQLSRGIMKNIFIDVPYFDMNGISQRALQMAQFDPYAIRRKKVKGSLKGGAVTIAGLITHNPEMASHGIATALSQFELDDATFTYARQKMLDWGVGGHEIDGVFADVMKMSVKNEESDLYIPSEASLGE